VVDEGIAGAQREGVEYRRRSKLHRLSRFHQREPELRRRFSNLG
jgi:hypothetical protein